MSRSWLGALVLFVACGDGGEAPEEIVIAVGLGSGHRVGVELAIEEINAGGGIAGRPVLTTGLEWMDPAFTGYRRTIAWAERVTKDPKVLAVIGHSDSPATLAAAGLYNEAGLPHLVTVATNPLITRLNPCTYRLSLDDTAQGRLLARHAVDDWGKKRIATFYVNDDYGRGLAEQFGREVVARGGELVSQILVGDRLDDRDVRVVRGRVEAWSQGGTPDLVTLLVRPDAGKRIVELLGPLKPAPALLAAENLGLILGEPSLAPRWQGARFLQFLHPDPGTGVPALEALRRPGNRPASYESVLAYDAVGVLKKAIELGGASRVGIRRALEAMAADGTTLYGLGGPFRFDRERNGSREVFVVEWGPTGTRIVSRLSPEYTTVEIPSGFAAVTTPAEVATGR